MRVMGSLTGEGQAHTAIARELVISAGTVEKPFASILTKSSLTESQIDQRRVLAVLRGLA